MEVVTVVQMEVAAKAEVTAVAKVLVVAARALAAAGAMKGKAAKAAAEGPVVVGLEEAAMVAEAMVAEREGVAKVAGKVAVVAGKRSRW